VTAPAGSDAAEADALVAFAERLAEASGAVIRAHFRQRGAVDRKDDATPVTAADREAETAIRRLIEAEHPDHGVWGEEHGRLRPEADDVWVIDPIDGTKSFICGVPLFGTLIALVRRGAPVLGVIDQPILGERWIGARGQPTRLNGRPVETRTAPGLAEAVLATTSLGQFAGADARAFARVAGSIGLLRHIPDCYSYAMLASGFVDLVVEAGLAPYDFFALVSVIEGAGGVITDWQGAPLGFDSDGRVAAAGCPALHARALELLAGA